MTAADAASDRERCFASGKVLSFGYLFFAPEKKSNSGAPAHETLLLPHKNTTNKRERPPKTAGGRSISSPEENSVSGY
ncbi:hypothetical protein [Lysobacter claricitrinus]|uniref:hypothetical protein n=1 Tax=Lysobacter claricitrinus TaxID=3367728 RepID=UPI0038B2CBB2